MNNINKKERLERKGSISLSFKFDLQLFADTETLSGDPYLPDHKAQNDFIDDDTIPEVSTSRTRRNNPYTISHIDKKYKAWCTYLMDARAENLDDWFAKVSIGITGGIQDWPGDGPRGGRWTFYPPYFQDPYATNIVLSAQDQQRVIHYFDSIVRVSSANHFALMLNTSPATRGARSAESYLSINTIENLVKHMDFSACTSMQYMFFGSGGGLRYPTAPFTTQTLTFENYTFTNGSRPNMDHMFEQSAFKGLVIKSNFVPSSMDYFLKDCKYLETVDLGNLASNIRFLTNLRETFAGCTRLKEVKGIIDTSGFRWNSVNGGDKWNTFSGCNNIQIPINFKRFDIGDFFDGDNENHLIDKYIASNGGELNDDVLKAILSDYLSLPRNMIRIV